MPMCCPECKKEVEMETRQEPIPPFESKLESSLKKKTNSWRLSLALRYRDPVQPGSLPLLLFMAKL